MRLKLRSDAGGLEAYPLDGNLTPVPHSPTLASTFRKVRIQVCCAAHRTARSPCEENPQNAGLPERNHGGHDRSADYCRELDEASFTVIPSPMRNEDLFHLIAAYDAAVASADPDDVKVGSSTTRVRDFVNRGPEFDRL
jgi:hypothetical protein